MPRPKPIFRISTELTYKRECHGFGVKPRNFSILYMLIPVLSVLITWAGGFWALAGNGPAEYGFPLPWKTVELVPTCFSCPQPTSYNWSFFILDAAFYAAIGYGIVLFYAWLCSRPA